MPKSFLLKDIILYVNLKNNDKGIYLKEKSNIRLL